MSESRSHIELVKIAYEYIRSRVPLDKHSLIQVDAADSSRPTAVNGRAIPDVQFWEDDLFIIGEAKTLNDFERDHSKAQYEAYINECNNFHGKAILVVSVPWQIVMTAKNYFRRKKREQGFDFEVVILNEAGGIFFV